MPSKISHSRAVVSLTGAIALLFFCSGCTSNQLPLPPTANNVRHLNNVAESPPPTKTQIEIMDEGSGKLTHQHVFGNDGVKSEIIINYKDKSTDHFWLRPDGVAHKFSSINADKIVLADLTLGADGLTPISGKEFRSDGSLRQNIETDPSSQNIKTTTYWRDGKTVFSVMERHPDKSFVISYYHKNGKTWGQKEGKFTPQKYALQAIQRYPFSLTKEIEFDPQTVRLSSSSFFNEDAQLTVKINFLSSNRHEKIGYNDNVTPNHKQVYSVHQNAYGGVFKKLLYTEVYNKDKQTVQYKVIMPKVARPKPPSYQIWPAEVHFFQEDGGTIVKYLGEYCSFQSQEYIDVDGQKEAMLPDENPYVYIPFMFYTLWDPPLYATDLYLNWQIYENQPTDFSFQTNSMDFLDPDRFY